MTLIDLPQGSFCCGQKSKDVEFPNLEDYHHPTETKISVNPRWVMAISETRWQEQTIDGYDPRTGDIKYSYAEKVGVKILMRDGVMYFVPDTTRDQFDAALAEQGGD